MGDRRCQGLSAGEADRYRRLFAAGTSSGGRRDRRAAAADGSDRAAGLVYQRSGTGAVELSYVWVSAMAPDCEARWAGVVPASLPEGGLGTPVGCGRCSSGGGEGRTLAAGTVMRRAMEVRSVILKRLVRLRDVKHIVRPPSRFASSRLTV